VLLCLPLLATMLSSLLSLPGTTWYLVAGDSRYVEFALGGSLFGPSSGRSITAEMVGRNIDHGIKFTRFSATLNCDQGLIRYRENITFDEEGRLLAKLPLPSIAWQPVKRDSAGEALQRFACLANNQLEPSTGYPTMQTKLKAADEFFRLFGLGLNVDAAGALAAVDARRAPKTFNDLLNVLVSAERQDFVRAIKTPDAPFIR